MKRKTSVVLAAALLVAAAMSTAMAVDPTIVTWDGGNDNWDAAKWNGGQAAFDVFGDDRMSNGAYDVTIDGASKVEYDSVLLGDLRPRSNDGPTSITIKEGSELHVFTANDGDPDGNWTQWDADLILEGGTYRRDFVSGGSANAGGIVMFGSWRSVQDQKININVNNGGLLNNDGQFWFGADEEHSLGLNVSVNINNGSLDLTGGDNYPASNNDNDVTADWALFYGTDQGDGNGAESSFLPKDEKYEVKFTGPGSITVDTGGIVVYRQDSAGAWDQPQDGTTATRSSYQDLWDAGILKAHGRSGATAANFDNFFTTSGAVGGADYMLTSNVLPVKQAVWDGGNGNWDDVNWNGGQDPFDVFDGNYGMSNAGYDVTIGGGAQVDYDSVLLGSMRPRSDKAPTTVTIKEGAQLHHITPTDGDQDGNWTTWDANLNLDGGTFKRSFVPGGNAEAGGILMMGSWRSTKDQEINMTLTNGGSLVNDGQVWFGADEEHALGLKVSVTINDGSWDLTGGDSYPTSNDDNEVYADLAFFYGTDQGDGDGNEFSFLPKGEEYEINFTGPGSITVDTGGIVVYTQAESGLWDQPQDGSLATRSSYEDLWNAGILKANGLSGLDSALFSDFFTVENDLGDVDYKLISLIGGVFDPADLNQDGFVDGLDLGIQLGNFDQVADAAGGELNGINPVDGLDLGILLGAWNPPAAVIANVPEPTSAVLLIGACCLLGLRRRA